MTRITLDLHKEEGTMADYIRQNLIALIALFAALGGTAVAATVATNSVTSKSIKTGAVKSPDVADDGLTGVDIDEATLSGIQGSQGPPGAKGDQGDPGPQGVQGLQGAQGLQGPAGFSDTTVITEAESTPAGTIETDSVTCPSSHPDVTGGGYEIDSGSGNIARVLDTRPSVTGQGWTVRMQNTGLDAVTYTIWAVCVQ